MFVNESWSRQFVLHNDLAVTSANISQSKQCAHITRTTARRLRKIDGFAVRAPNKTCPSCRLRCRSLNDWLAFRSTTRIYCSSVVASSRRKRGIWNVECVLHVHSHHTAHFRRILTKSYKAVPASHPTSDKEYGSLCWNVFFFYFSHLVAASTALSKSPSVTDPFLCWMAYSKKPNLRIDIELCSRHSGGRTSFLAGNSISIGLRLHNAK